MKWKYATSAVFFVALISTWPVYFKMRQSHREASYGVAIASFERDLHIGMAGEDVEKCLSLRHLEYHVVRRRKP